MPSAFSHALVGAAIGSSAPESRPSWLLPVFAALAAAPDLDVIGLHLGVPYAHPLGHRGLSHSLVFAAVLALVSIPFWTRVVDEHARRLAFLTFLAVGSHGFLDAFTDAGHGIGLFVPLVDERYFAPWRPILTSPLSVRSFFSGSGVTILANEAVYVGLPTALVLVVRGAAARVRRRTD